MIISINWLKKFTDIDLPIDELVELIGSRLVEVESVTNLGKKYEGIVIAKVMECTPLEGTDHLSLVKIDDGGEVKDVKRDDKGLVQVVCGAPNVRADIYVAWLPPKSVVPATYDTPEPLVLDTREIRGHISNGMLASPQELDLSDNHEGIMEIPESVPGRLFASIYELDDYLLDIDNKSLTHRPDCFGVIGFAREVAAIQGKEFTTPEWLVKLDPVFDGSNETELKVSIDDPELSERYQAVILTDINETREAFPLTPTLIARSGMRSISPVVDVTNYMMLSTGQPLHAFDYDKLLAVGNGKIDIHVRAGREGETLELIDGRTVKLDPADIVIANGDKAVALAGAMGGADTEIDEGTKRIMLESATFNLYRLRSTQMRHGIFSEAVTRFTKGQPADLTAPVLAQAIHLLKAWTTAQQVSDVAEAKGRSIKNPNIELTVNEVNGLLGTAMSQGEIESVLRNVEFATTESGHNTLAVSPPYWRQDIHIKEDVIEEVGRINGFDMINPTLPLRDFTAVNVSEFDEFRRSLRKILTRAGANEVLNYSFVHGDTLTKTNQKLEDSYRLTNSLSPELQFYRQSLTPSLLQLVHPNIKSGFDEFALFEFNKAHPKQRALTVENVPDEADSIALVVASKTKSAGAPYYKAKRILDFICAAQGLDLIYEPIDQEVMYPTSAPFEHRRSAVVKDKASGEQIGMVGEYKKSVIKNFKLPAFVAGFELDASAVFFAAQKQEARYRPMSRYPGSERDICFKVKSDIDYGRVISVAEEALRSSSLETTITPVDIYMPENKATKNITIRIKLISHDHTLVNAEIAAVMSSVSDMVVSSLQAEVV